MSLGKNIQYLRHINGSMTQETLAERMNVSRQSVSKWESDESWPDMEKLIAMCDLFSCKLDELVREDMSDRENVYSPVTIRTMPGFTMARYVMITPNPEDDVQAYMRAWGKNSGLLDACANPRLIGWDFPFVSVDQQTRFGLRGYAAAYVLPEGFTPACGGVEIASQKTARYAVTTITEPFKGPFQRIPGAYQHILRFLEARGGTKPDETGLIPCFEHEYEKDGVQYMDVYILAE